MKKTIWTFGLISGAISSVMMACMLPFLDEIGFDKGMIVGYTTIVLSFLMVIFGIRSYRDNVGNGQISFGRAFTVGILITLISCVCYVIVWEVIYFKVMPEFGEKFTAYAIEQVKASGASQQVLEAKTQELKEFKAMYDNPLFNAGITFLEPFPIGLVITLVSAFIFSRKRSAASIRNEANQQGAAMV